MFLSLVLTFKINFAQHSLNIFRQFNPNKLQIGKTTRKINKPKTEALLGIKRQFNLNLHFITIFGVKAHNQLLQSFIQILVELDQLDYFWINWINLLYNLRGI